MPSPDAIALEQLAKSGSDLTKLHHIDFTLHFPSQFSAQRAELQLTALAFLDINVEKGKSGNDWIIHGWKRMYPVESDLQGLRDKLELIAAEGHGRYDGWKAKAISQP